MCLSSIRFEEKYLRAASRLPPPMNCFIFHVKRPNGGALHRWERVLVEGCGTREQYMVCDETEPVE